MQVVEGEGGVKGGEGMYSARAPNTARGARALPGRTGLAGVVG